MFNNALGFQTGLDAWTLADPFKAENKQQK
jgi:hypothetical protein